MSNEEHHMNETDGYILKLPNLSDSFVLMNKNDHVLVLPVMLHSVGVLLLSFFFFNSDKSDPIL